MAEAVVLHDQVSYTHPDHQGEGRKTLAPGVSPAMSFASRGTVLSTEDSDDITAAERIDEKELRRLEALGAVTTDTKSMSADLAKAGQPPLDTGRALPYINLTSNVEQVRAVKAAAAFAGGVSPRSAPRDLIRLDERDLRVMAQAFGYGDLANDANTGKEELIAALTGKADDAEDPAEAKTREQQRDQLQVEAREHGGQREAGLVGGNVLADGAAADTGRRLSRAQTSGIDATDSAQKLAAEHGVDLSSLQGSGQSGRITKEDVQDEIDRHA